MHPVRKRRLKWLLVWLCLLSIVVGLVLYALRQNISLFYTPTQLLQAHVLPHQQIRLGGMVQKGSIERLNHGQSVRFLVTDFQHEVWVSYRGVLPDLFREGQGVVVNGTVNNNGQVSAQEVLAKHDATYMAPAIRGLIPPASKDSKHVA